MIDVRVTLVDGNADPTYTWEKTLWWAALIATKEALKRAKPVLEPVFAVEVVTPEEFVANITDRYQEALPAVSQGVTDHDGLEAST